MARKPSGGKPRSNERDDLLWLETYFILFPRERRPTLAQVEHALAEANPHLLLQNLAADDEGRFASLLVQSPEDHAAVEVSFEMGEAIIEQNLEWAKQLQQQLSPKQLQAIIAADARLDVAHFERVQSSGAAKPPEAEARRAVANHDDEEMDFDDDFDPGDDDFDEEAALEIFDPTCLLTVVEALSKLTRGLAIDPAAGEVV
jgi:hypothetical protein